VLQQCKSGCEIREKLSRHDTFVPTFDGSKRDASRSRVDEPGLRSPKRPLTGFNRFATCSMIWRLAAETPDAREEAMQW
jgi:hypothetical protein